MRAQDAAGSVAPVTTEPGHSDPGQSNPGQSASARPDSGKDAAALRTIGEVARLLGVKAHVLRYWEEQFPMLRPLTRAGGRRYYRVGDVALLGEIDRLLHREGYTIRGARQWLQQQGRRGAVRPPAAKAPAAAAVAPAPPVEPAPLAADGPPEQQIVAAVGALRRELSAIRNRLAQGLAATALPD